jgi:two-component system, NtrC family, response regulator AtoC
LYAELAETTKAAAESQDETMNAPRSILLIEDEATLADNIRAYLGRFSYQVRIAPNAGAGLRELEGFKPEAVLLDFHLPDMDGLEILPQIRSRAPNTKVLMVTGHGSERVAVDAMKAGAHDYLTKPIALQQVRLALERALQGPVPALDEVSEPLARLVGESEPMSALKARVRQVIAAESRLVDADPPAALVVGETGTGKELIARALHFGGSRRAGPFIEVNCSGIPANLLEAELFGYERGAFTDARERKLGLIEVANGGTLFLDEIGDIDPSAQAKLLKLLENKIVRRLGSVQERKVDVRIIAATHRNLEHLVQEGIFRSDLYFRLGVIRLEAPPLRKRGADIGLLAEHFLRHHCARYGKKPLRLADDALAELFAYYWPGNVRELRNTLEQCVVLARGEAIAATDLGLAAGLFSPSAPTVPRENDVLNLEKAEQDLLLRALEQCEWNVSRAARLLGVSRDKLRYRMAKHQLKTTS